MRSFPETPLLSLPMNAMYDMKYKIYYIESIINDMTQAKAGVHEAPGLEAQACLI